MPRTPSPTRSAPRIAPSSSSRRPRSTTRSRPRHNADSPRYDRGVDDDAVGAAIERARAAWPDFTVDEARFAGRLRQWDEPIDEVSDYYLAFACASGEPNALATLDRVYFAQLRGPLAKMGLDNSGIDDTLQAMHEELLAAKDPKILG